MATSEQPTTGADDGDGLERDPSADHPGIDHGDLRPVIEFALLVGAEGRRRRPPLEMPDELRRHLDGQHVSKRAMARIRRAIDASPEFRARLAVGLNADPTADLVDELGRLWLERPAGWHARVDVLLAERATAAAAAEDERQARREEKRRLAAEQARDRAESELAAQRDELTRLRRELTEARDELRAARDEIAVQVEAVREARLAVRHAEDRERAAAARASTAEEARTAADRDRERAAALRDDALADRTGVAVGRAEVETAAERAQALADQLRALVALPDAPAPRTERRVPLRLPGGVIATSAEAAEFLARSDAAMVIDGYNVSQLIWSARPIDQQRAALLDATENLARRFGTDATVVFDGADVVGAHSDRRRFVRVVYSPEGVTADDVIRDEVRRLPAGRAVVVVTDDREIVADVRSWGANPLPSGALAALF